MRKHNQTATGLFIVNNLFILYCIIFQNLNFNSVLFLLYFDIVISIPFQLSKAEYCAIRESEENDLKYAGKLSYWEERKYRGRSEFTYLAGNLILIGLLFLYLMIVPDLVMTKSKHILGLVHEMFPFGDIWFLCCFASSVLLETGKHIYFFITGQNKNAYFEKYINIDFNKYWLFFAYVLVGSSIVGFISTMNSYRPFFATISFAVLYVAMKTFFEYRAQKKDSVIIKTEI